MGSVGPAPAPPDGRPTDLRLLVLVLFTGWAALLSVESWFRPPGVERPVPFPTTVLRPEGTYHRVPQVADHQPLPPQVVVLQAADYRGPDGQRLALRWITHTSSSRGGINFDFPSIATAVLGPGTRGHCQRISAAGPEATLLGSETELRAALAASAPQGFERLLWLAGLRPYQANACLWTGTVARPSPSAPRRAPSRFE
ncbi:hypothetical protein [Cyanobium sp. Morenito 9A2]|uniref:hypothetical protein n=1 Tax=Cyanobium sp. Morenito 9A2 TaxID=2823718 RepID=UPI0020CBC098|nr:hypothetical protein [Cyanobium sp. Morenito 9A2]MCP9849809.1 hypothetical protein [Cyanobium sp. Morenito 9A2]